MTCLWLLVFHLGLSQANAKVSNHFTRAHNFGRKDSWLVDAMRLSGESAQVYQQSLKHLRANPNLDAELRKALLENNTHAYLALDVIAALKRESVFADLLADAKQDSGGFFFITLNSFFNSSHQKQLTDFYEATLDNVKASGAVKMIVLDTFGRIGHTLPESNIAKLLGDEHVPEVRSAALYYVRAFLKRNDRKYLNLLRDFDEKFKASAHSSTLYDAEFSAQLDSLLAENRLSKAQP
jgi:hypothetical protein